MNSRPLVNGTYDLPLPQAKRRTLVLIGAATMIPVFFAFTGALENLGMLIAIIVCMVIGAACHTRLAMSIQNIAQTNPARLDERQRATRDRAFTLALRYLGWMLTIAWVYAMIARFTGWWLPDAQNLWIVLWGFGMQVYGLPTAIAAWLEPDPLN